MNIIDAVKSGRPFRRKAWGRDEWHSPDTWSKQFLKHDILEDDWELKEPAVTITLTQFYGAVAEVMKDCESEETFFIGHNVRKNPAKELARRLGLEEK